MPQLIRRTRSHQAYQAHAVTSLQLPEGPADHKKGGGRYQKVRDRTCDQHSVDSHKTRQYEQQNDQDQLLGKRDNDTVFGLFDGDHGIHGNGKDTGQNDQHHKLVHIAQGEFFIPACTAAEKAQDLMGEKTEAEGLQGADSKRVEVEQKCRVLDPLIIFGSVVESHERLSSDTAPDDGGVKEKVYFCDDAGGRQRLTPAVYRQGAIAAEGTVEDQIHGQHGRLVEAARCADRSDLRDLAFRHRKVRTCQLSGPEAQHICRNQKRGDNLSHNRGDCRSGDSHVERKKKEVIQHKIQDYTGHRAEERVAGAAVGPDQKRSARGQCQEGKAQRDQPHVGKSIGVYLFCRAEEIDKGRCEKKNQNRNLFYSKARNPRQKQPQIQKHKRLFQKKADCFLRQQDLAGRHI